MTDLTQEQIEEAMIYGSTLSKQAPGGSGTTIFTYSFEPSLDRTGITYKSWTQDYRDQTLEILAEYERVLDVTFTPGNSVSRHLDFSLATAIDGGATGRGGRSFSYDNSLTIVDYTGWTTVNVALSYVDYKETFVHELGHALSLKHPFSTPVLPTAYNHNGYTVMSYTGDPGPSDLVGDPVTWNALRQDDLALFDVIALQALWGANVTHNMGDTSYDDTTAISRVLVDGGGEDTLELGDWFSANMNAIIELARGGMSEIANGTDFLRFGIDLNTDIEHVVAPATARVTVTGNDLANRIEATEVWGEGGFAAADHFEGLGGNDTLSGYTGDDTLLGGLGNDLIFGGSGADDLRGEDGDDIVLGGLGADLIDGGAGGDLLLGDAVELA